MAVQKIGRREALGTMGSVAAFLSGCADITGPSDPAETSSIPSSSPVSTPTGTTNETETSTPEREWEIEPLEHDKLVGAQYYLWYWGEDGYDLDTSVPWLEHSPYTPELGQYDSRNEDVINQHIKWAVEHGINWFIITADHEHGGPRDRNIQETFMNAELKDEINWSILTGFDVYSSEHLGQAFEYYEEKFFHDPSYLHINGRPVLYDWAIGQFPADKEEAFDEAKDAIDSDPYLIADPRGFWPPPTTDPPTAYDAINKYALLQPDGDYSGFPEEVGQKSREWLFRTEYHDLDFIPTVMPGFNDQEITWKGSARKHPILDLSPEEFREICREALTYVDPEIEALVITSFNEFPEGSTIEPTEEYGHKRLDIVKEELAMKAADPLPLNDYSLMELEFNRTFKPSEINNESTGERDLAFMAGGIEFVSEDTSLSYDIGVPEAEPVFVHGVYGREKSENHSPSSWRWLGGPDALTALYADPATSDATEAVIYGRPLVEDEIEADVYFNGELTDHVSFAGGETGSGRYPISLHPS